MKFTVQSKFTENASGSHLQGEIEIPYEVLVATFGQPLAGGDKTDAEWEIEFEDETIATIYNWKDGPNYCGAEGCPVHLITEWHIGGFNHRAVELVKEALGLVY